MLKTPKKGIQIIFILRLKNSKYEMIRDNINSTINLCLNLNPKNWLFFKEAIFLKSSKNPRIPNDKKVKIIIIISVAADGQLLKIFFLKIEYIKIKKKKTKTVVKRTRIPPPIGVPFLSLLKRSKIGVGRFKKSLDFCGWC